MAEITPILPYVRGNSRNKIIFSKNRIDGLEYIDVGKELSKLLSSQENKNSGYDTLCRQLFNRNSFKENIGKYLAIENIGILFEPDLHLNLKSIIDSYSKSQTLIISAPGEIIDNKFYFYSPYSNITINLEGLSFKSI